MSLKLITAPTVPALDLAQCKLDLRAPSGSSEDAYIARLIRTATALAEHETGRAIMEQDWELVIDAFPAAEIELAKPPQMSVTSVKYLDAAGAEQTLPGSAYTLDADKLPGYLFPALGTSWPDTQDVANAVRVRFKCGHATNAAQLLALAPGIADWIQVQVATLYDNRDLVALGKVDSGPGSYGHDLIQPYRTYL
jgi:uncharacterized phiE125 gp8 family phage protein